MMKGVKENSPPPKSKSASKPSSPSNISEIILSISTLTATIATLVTDRKNDRLLIEANMKSINDFHSHVSSTTPMSPMMNPLDHLDDEIPTIRKEPRRSSYDVAMKRFPIESANIKNTPVMSKLEVKHLSLSYFLIFWKNFINLQQKHPFDPGALPLHLNPSI